MTDETTYRLPDDAEITLTQIRRFLAVADLLDYGAAALRLGTTYDELDRDISSLQDVLGVRLVERKTDPVVLTSAGVRFAGLFERHQAELEDLIGSVHTKRSTVVSHVTLGYFEGWNLSGFLSTTTFDLQSSYRGISVSTVGGSAMWLAQELEAGHIDGAIMLRVTAEGLQKIGMLASASVDTVFSVGRCLAYSDRNPLWGREGLVPTDFAGQVLYVGRDERVPNGVPTAQELCRRLGLDPNVWLVDTQKDVTAQVFAGGGYAVVDDANTLLEHRRIRHVDLDESHEVALVAQMPFSAEAEFIRTYLLARRTEGTLAL